MADFFDCPVAYNPTTGLHVPNATFQVFSPEDAAFSTPLPTFDATSGVPRPITSDQNGVLPQFAVQGDLTEVIIKSGNFTTRLLSTFGRRGEPGPSGKSAFEAAQEAGYEGTEEDFAAQLANPVSDSRLAGAVSDYMVEHPVEAEFVGTADDIEDGAAKKFVTPDEKGYIATIPLMQEQLAELAEQTPEVPEGVLVVVDVVSGHESRPAAARVLWVGGESRPTYMADGDLWLAAGVEPEPEPDVAPEITTTTLAGMTVGVAFSQTLAATGTVPITWERSAGTIPAGLSLSGNVLSGTPTTAGSYNFTIRASNDAGSDTQQFTGTITAAPVAPDITTTTMGSMTQGTAFSRTIAVTGTAPITFAVSAGTLPAGLSLNAATGVVSGTPTGSGAYSFTVRASNATGSDTQVFTGTITAAGTGPNISTTTLAGGTVGVAFDRTIAATGTAPITWSVSAGALPAGVTLNTATGALSGSPTTAGSYTFTIQAVNSFGSDTQAFTVAIAAAPVSGPMSIFGSSAPGTGATVMNDSGAIATGTRFYATKQIRVLGLRVWNPVGAVSAFLTTPFTATAHTADWSGADVTTSNWDSPVQSKRYTAARTAGQWTDVLFDTPFVLNPIASGAGGPDYVTLGVLYDSGDYYVTVAGLGAASIPSAEDDDVHLAEQTFQRGAFSPASGAQTYFGIDMIFEVA